MYTVEVITGILFLHRNVTVFQDTFFSALKLTKFLLSAGVLKDL